MTSKPPLRVLIVDDEPLARQRIEDLLGHESDVEIVGMADRLFDLATSIATGPPR